MSSTTRITGMYSGMDTDALIEEMLAANKTPLNNYTREKTEVEWQRETLIDLNKQLLELQNASKGMQEVSSFKDFNAESTNNRIVTATATTDALEGTYTIKTEQLATTTTFTSTSISDNINVAKIQSKGLVMATTSLENTSFNLTVNGVTKTIVFGEGEGKFTTPAQVGEAFQKKMDDAFGAGQIKVTAEPIGPAYRLKIEAGENALNVPIVITSGGDEEAGLTDTLTKLQIDSRSTNIFNTGITIKDFLKLDENKEITFKVNGYKETISTDTTLSDFFKKINNADIDISMKYDSLSDAIIMKRESSGAGREIDVEDDLGLFTALGLVKSDETYKSGQNARVSIIDPEGRAKECIEVEKVKRDANGKVVLDDDGNPIIEKDANGNPIMELVGGLELTSNTFTYEGVTFNLLKTNPNEEVSITVSKDVDAVFDKVVQFVDKYNTILGKLNELYNEKPNRDYDPLLDEEREELTDTQQEKWDKLARQGILYRDSTLQNTISQMRSAVTSILSTNSDIKSLFQIGISTTPYSATGSDNGKLIVDEEKLREAISNNMDDVAALFTNKPEYINGTVIDMENTKITQGSSFKITVDGKEETITFDKDYDLADTEQRNDMISNINSILSSKFGPRNITLAISSDRIVINSSKGNNITINSGESGADALAMLGLQDGAKFDGNALGFASKITNVMDTAMSSISEKAGTSANTVDTSTLGTRMKKLNDYITRQQERLERLEDRYYAQFTAMENALAQMESQSSYLTSMLSGS